MATMDEEHNHDAVLAELEAVLETLGARPERWPPDRRARLMTLVDSDVRAAQAFSEAKALDRLLGMAPDGSAADADLQARILAAAGHTPQAHRPLTIVGGVDGARGRSEHASGGSRQRRWQAAALLAASLLLGVFIGLSGSAIPVLQDISIVAVAEGAGSWGLGGALFAPDSMGGLVQL